MSIAIDEAKLAAKSGEVPVGAVIVKDDTVIASAHNICEAEKSPLCHAELIAIYKALKVLGTERLDECDLYVTLEPCAMCAGAISLARIRRLFFGAYDKSGGCVVSDKFLLDKDSPMRSVEYYCGICEEECSKLLKDFFKELR